MPITDAGITDTQSFGLVIRDVFYDALDRDPFFDAYTKRKTRMLAVMRWAKLGTATLTDNRSARTATLRIMRPPLVS